MTKIPQFVLKVLLVLPLSASVFAGPREVAEETATHWSNAFRQGRIEEILSLYAEDAMVLQPNGQLSRTPEEIRDFWQKLIERKNGEYRIDVVDVRAEKDGSILATLHLSRQQDLIESLRPVKFSQDGELVNLFKRQKDGAWKIQVQRWS